MSFPRSVDVIEADLDSLWLCVFEISEDEYERREALLSAEFDVAVEARRVRDAKGNLANRIARMRGAC